MSFVDQPDLQNSFDVSLLDEGILFSTKNSDKNAANNVEGEIYIYKVNFI